MKMLPEKLTAILGLHARQICSPLITRYTIHFGDLTENLNLWCWPQHVVSFFWEAASGLNLAIKFVSKQMRYKFKVLLLSECSAPSVLGANRFDHEDIMLSERGIEKCWWIKLACKVLCPEEWCLFFLSHVFQIMISWCNLSFPMPIRFLLLFYFELKVNLTRVENKTFQLHYHSRLQNWFLI